MFILVLANTFIRILRLLASLSAQNWKFNIQNSKFKFFMKALIIDDEKKARNLLRTILGEYCPDVTEIKEAADLPEGIKTINTFHPDVVFLDIEMPAYSGTQILDFFEPDDIDFHIVFTTAYSEHAVKAFQMNAVDYLLKPLRPNQVKEAVIKVKDAIKKEGVFPPNRGTEDGL